MDGLTQTLIGLAISGITFVAYKHPDAYRKLELPQTVFKVICVLFGGQVLWNFAVKETIAKLTPFIKETAIKDMDKIVAPLTMTFKNMAFMGAFYLSAWLFFVILYFLHSLLGIKPNKE